MRGNGRWEPAVSGAAVVSEAPLRQPGPPRRRARRQPELSGQQRAGSRGTTGASAEDSSAGGVRRTGAGEGEGPCAAPQAHCPFLPRGPPVGLGCGIGMRAVGWAVGLGRMEASGPPAPQCCCQHQNSAPPPTPPALHPVTPDPLQPSRTGAKVGCGYWELRGGYRGI